jgi:hypothetical protein
MASNDLFSSIEKSILTTILYSDIFHFPLTREELWRFLISDKAITRKEFAAALEHLGEKIGYKDGYYFLSGNEAIVEQRKKHLPEVKKKLQIAKKAAFYLSYIPTIKFIGISGGLALENAQSDDDIDLFIIVKKGTLFTTRFWILALLEWKQLRRKREEKNPSDKICINLLVDETRLLWPAKKRDLYIAHEIAQIKPLFERTGTYQKFMDSNSWIKKFLPNSLDEKSIFLGNHWETNYLTLQFFSFFMSLRPIESFMRKFQKEYMKKHRTTEIVTQTLLALHPYDYRVSTLTILRTKCEKLGLLTNL